MRNKEIIRCEDCGEVFNQDLETGLCSSCDTSELVDEKINTNIQEDLADGEGGEEE
jgi:Zn finger protein HypA/HybF involved in hydrogenase expression